jgi:tRNA dimethylallyltransferase
MALPKIIAVVGPTASGKSALGIEIARRFDGEVLCVDSRTVYRGMDVGTAKPEGVKPEGLGDDISGLFAGGKPLLVDGIPHWGLDLIDPSEEYSVSEFKRYADKRIADIVKRGKLPVLVGGTGLWIRVVADNLNLAETPPDAKLRFELEGRHIDDLFAEYKRLDPEGAEVIDRDNKRRVIRALEVTKKTGKPFSQAMSAGTPKYDVLQVALNVPRAELLRRIDHRVDVMVAEGLIDEARALFTKYGAEASGLSAIGYRELSYFFDGKANLTATIEQIKKDTRAYAKRQETWFKKYGNVKWVKDNEEALRLAEDFLG